MLIRGLPGESAWGHFLRNRDEQPITNPREAEDTLAMLYPGLGG